MTQLMPSSSYPLRRELRVLTYAALVDRRAAPVHSEQGDLHGISRRRHQHPVQEDAGAGPRAFRAFLEFDQKAFKDGAIPGKMKELMALAIAQITQCPWCIQAHTKKAAMAGASDPEIAETTFVAMAMAAGAAWSHGGLALQRLQEHKESAAR